MSKLIDAASRNVAPIHAGAEGQMGQNRQLLRGVAAIDVQRRIGLGVAESLRLVHGGFVVGSLLFHLRENEIAGAVQNAAERLNLIGRQSTG